jgi:hypothetical protein
MMMTVMPTVAVYAHAGIRLEVDPHLVRNSVHENEVVELEDEQDRHGIQRHILGVGTVADNDDADSRGDERQHRVLPDYRQDVESQVPEVGWQAKAILDSVQKRAAVGANWKGSTRCDSDMRYALISSKTP